MDYLEEQTQELEALKSIYYTEFQELSTSPPSFKINIPLDLSTTTPQSTLHIQITYTPTYPDTIPEIEISISSEDSEEFELLSEQELENVRDAAIKECENNLGMAMVFTLVSFLKEFVEGLVGDRIEKEELEREERVRREEEEELKRYQGTRVTPEAFENWRKGFLKEMQELLSKEGKSVDLKKGKFTGKQLFEKDQTLAKSDMVFAEEGVEVDLALFEDMDGLDDDDDEEEGNAVLAGFTEDD
ncbi:hypothetical protein HK098_003322 [Nowakowskiella sp. JEL0407]|nr:hypothetical protein HK098_003322 [Nowakowskiella sp. JEL0407]